MVSDLGIEWNRPNRKFSIVDMSIKTRNMYHFSLLGSELIAAKATCT